MNTKELVSRLVEINSSTKEGANRAIDYCLEWLHNRGFFAKKLRNNGYDMLVCEIGNGQKTLILNGHVDVVSAKPHQFIPYEKDGKLYGRGTADMKAGVAAFMLAMAELKEKELNCKIQLQIVSDEEIGGFNCSSYLADNGYLGDFVICSEPTQLGIGLQAKGLLQVDIKVQGDSAHGSRPWEGNNAIVKAYEIYQKILKLDFAKESSEFYAFPSINLAKIRGGDAYNKVPDSCVMSLDIRFLPHQTKEELIEQIKCVTDSEIDIHMYGEPVRTKKDSPYIGSLISVIESLRMDRANIFGQHGSADTRFFSPYQIPAIEFGPSGGEWHGDHEYVVIDSVEEYKNIIKEFALRFHLVENESQQELY